MYRSFNFCVVRPVILSSDTVRNFRELPGGQYYWQFHCHGPGSVLGEATEISHKPHSTAKIKKYFFFFSPCIFSFILSLELVINLKFGFILLCNVEILSFIFKRFFFPFRLTKMNKLSEKIKYRHSDELTSLLGYFPNKTA